ncbi:COG0790 FOG, TPR repeat, SEL1 subfamily [Comamonadaceae bacterium]
MPALKLHLPPSPDILKSMTPQDWQAVTQAEPISAARWMGAAAVLGSADAQAIAGQWLLDGHGQPRNPDAARASFLKAAQQAHPMGMNMAGRCFENGWGGDVDYFAAANWYRQAAHAGLDAAMYNYANLLAAGMGVAQDDAAALEWYRHAAARGHAKSMTKIGYFYEDGRVVTRDLNAAFVWFEGGATGGDFRGQFNYATLLAQRGDLQAALHWLRKVPATATAAYLRQAGQRLLDSSYPEIRSIGESMLQKAA